jgi:hypothetical protein
MIECFRVCLQQVVVTDANIRINEAIAPTIRPMNAVYGLASPRQICLSSSSSFALPRRCFLRLVQSREHHLDGGVQAVLRGV